MLLIISGLLAAKMKISHISVTYCILQASKSLFFGFSDPHYTNHQLFQKYLASGILQSSSASLRRLWLFFLPRTVKYLKSTKGSNLHSSKTFNDYKRVIDNKQHWFGAPLASVWNVWWIPVSITYIQDIKL